MCSFYEWWKYIVGNLVSVTGLTHVSPISGNAFAEILDLLVAVWSLTVTGLTIGLVGGLAWVTTVTDKMDSRISSSVNYWWEGSTFNKFRSRVQQLASKTGGLSFDDFVQLCVERQLNITRARMEAVFREADKDGSGLVNTPEIETLLQALEQDRRTAIEEFAASSFDEEPAWEPSFRAPMRVEAVSLVRKESSSAEFDAQAFEARFDAIETKLARMDAIETKLEALLSALAPAPPAKAADLKH